MKYDNNGYKIVVSPSEDTSKEYLLNYVSAPSVQIKQAIVKGLTDGLTKQEIETQIKAIIRGSLLNCPSKLKADVERSLKSMAQRDFYVLSNNGKVLQKQFDVAYEKATGQKAKLDIFNIPYDTEFRGENTDAPKGLPVIKDYQQKVREQIKTISALTPVTVTDDGKVISMRNKVEMQVRYEANQKDLKEMEDSGTDLVWISSHADCSKRCEPWQGKLFSISGANSGKVIDGNQVEKMSLNEVMALNGGNSIINGYNCRHYMIEYRKGTKAPKTYSAAEIKKQRNIDTRQRSYENNIRQLKMQQALAHANGDKAQADKLSKRWHNLEKRYQVYSLSNGRAYYPWRTQVSNNERDAIQEANEENNQ